jgi:spore coat protein U-like protein
MKSMIKLKCKIEWLGALIAFAVLPLFIADLTFAACNVSTTPVSFGSYDIFSPGPNDATGSISFVCDETPPPAAVTVAIGQSPNSGGFDPRQMKLTGGTDLLHYNLYTNASYTSIWGDNTGGTVTQSRRAPKNKTVTFQVYGRIPPSQDVSAGSYNDTLTVTITW